jgi:hypothetical protein
MPPTAPEHEELKKLLEENLAVAKDNNRLLREMRRNALLGFFAKIVIWLVLLGVPLLFLSSYIGPLMSAFGGASPTGESLKPGLFGLPSAEQVSDLMEQYKELSQ